MTLRRRPIVLPLNTMKKGDEAAESWHTQRALEYSDHAYKLAKKAHDKSGRMEAV